ncbi:MAG: 30S ribosomal protein S2 [Proteobacteria bacterium]|nr:30S ribosomal protein S2 [Pseudomonadota bacterium]
MKKNPFNFTVKEMIECGVHFGHRQNRWNPKMRQYIYGSKNGVHIIDLQQSAQMLARAASILKDVASRNGRILFVGTKRQGTDIIAEHAIRCGQNYVNHRWLGGMLTNWGTVSNSIKTLREYETTLEDEASKEKMTKKELIELSRKHQKLERVLGGIRNMGGMPDIVFILDTIQESLAVREAQKLGIPVVAIVDTNAPLDGIDYVIPGNDDARKAIELYCRVLSDAILAGIEEGMINSGVDFGASESPEGLIAAEAGTVRGGKAKQNKDKAGKEERKPASEPSATKPEKQGTEEVEVTKKQPNKKPAATKTAAKKADTKSAK